MTRRFLAGVLGATALAFAGATTALATDDQTPTGEMGVDKNDPARQDPMEGLNRAIFEFNGVFYEVTTPIVEATPDPIRGMFKALGTAASAPFHIVTSLATNNQENDNLSDIARENGVDCGFFVVLPFAGPTTSRDAVGTGVEAGAQIMAGQIVYVGAGAAANDRIEAEVQIKQLDGSLDEYAMARSATMQDAGCVVVDEADAPTLFGDEPAAAEAAAGK